MPGHTEQSQNTFIVRFWWKWQVEDPDRTMTWCGRVEHVQSGEGMTFIDVRQLLTFIERFVAPLSSPSHEEGKKDLDMDRARGVR